MDDGRPHLGRRFAAAVVLTARYVAFLPLYALRGIVRRLLNILAGACLLSVVVLLAEGQGLGRLTIIMAGVSFAAFTLAWFYDMLLLRLSPRPLFLIQ